MHKVANPGLAEAMRELRQGSRTSRHRDRHALRKKGVGKGGRGAWKREAPFGVSKDVYSPYV